MAPVSYSEEPSSQTIQRSETRLAGLPVGVSNAGSARCNRLYAGAPIRGKLAAPASLFEHLCDVNAVTQNPAKVMKRPQVERYEGKTPSLSDHPARDARN